MFVKICGMTRQADLDLAREAGCAMAGFIFAGKSPRRIAPEAASRLATGGMLRVGVFVEDGKWKMNPPLRGASDREALIEGLIDGTIDCIATDHAPHSAEEKSRGLAGSAFGIVGIETAFPLIYTYLVVPGTISMDKLEQLLVYNPRRRFGIPLGNDYSVWDLSEEWNISGAEMLSKGRATPFEGWHVMGRNYLTVSDGRAAYSFMKNSRG